MRQMLQVALAGVALVVSGSANAQDWGSSYGSSGYGYERGYGSGYYDRDDDRTARTICSGQRAHGLEARLRHERDEGEIDGDTARRIHATIDRLEDRQRHECAEGDDRAIAAISDRYDRIEQWIGAEAHGGWGY
jgi:hypothetical protein